MSPYPRLSQLLDPLGLQRFRCLLVSALFIGGQGWLYLRPTIAASPSPGVIIENQATGSYLNDSTETQTIQSIESDKVTLTVTEVAGITIGIGGISGVTTTGGLAFLDFILTNVGNDPTQFFIPGAPSAISSGGSQSGQIEIVAYDIDGGAVNTTVPLNVSVPASGATTGTLLAAVATANRGVIPVGATIRIRVPIQIAAGSGSSVDVTMGNTTPANGQNQPYVASGVANKVYTVDNSDGTAGEAFGSPVEERQASITQSLAVTASGTPSSNNIPTLTCTSDRRIFNTAYGGNGSYLISGRDPHWESAIGASNLPTSGPIPTTGWINSYNVEAVKPAWAWIDSPYNDSAWISHFSDAIHTSQGRVDVYFRYKFYLDPAIDVTSFQVKMDFFGDNSVTDIFVNGVSQTANHPSILPQPQGGGDPYQYRGFEGTGRAALTLTQNWQTGANEIVVQVKSDPGYMGLIAESQPSYLCKSDAGDAPISYGDPTHTIISTPKVYLGNTPPTADPFGGHPSPGADGDTDDAFTTPLVAPVASTYNLAVPVRNTSSQPVNLYGWIDFNKDGKFGAGEFQTVSVPSNATTANLNWTLPTGTTLGSTYARFRLTTDTLTDNPTTTDVDERSTTPANNGEVEDYTLLLTQPNLLLVKRITAINGLPNKRGGGSLGNYENDPNNPYDDNNNDPPTGPYTRPTTNKWPATVRDNSSIFLLGGIDGGQVAPTDSIEYTIYFLSAGNAIANNVLFCDRVPANVSFIPNSFNNANPPISPNPSGLSGAERGIVVNLGGTIESYTNTADGDFAQYFPPGNNPTATFAKIDCGGANTNGAVVVNLGNLQNATDAGIPASSYGFIRFRGRVK
jgi:uncharacterized repeat protein (TIGR01451 family)